MWAWIGSPVSIEYFDRRPFKFDDRIAGVKVQLTRSEQPSHDEPLRDLLIDGILLALPVGATAYLLHKVIGALLQLLAPIAHLLPQGHFRGIAGLDRRRSCS